MDKKWHYTKDGDYPVVFGSYINQSYPQIPCIVLRHGMYGVRYWNAIEECWDDEECDDYECDKDDVERWMYLDPIIEEA